ncbi:hypothetical protein VOLCADRAFT_87512 [Volvox carteri f. nagariensis]|uniref:Peptidase M11 gametolysin domain-containing protein n=1 Tax=Volvox carteri f. nagariensis TaxID=3068 RepID=D8TLH9_VOLCA|nr:uncharacterized protein VOLCADRAFT_87512 [Volvox carteri f. nagariensis]EFJ51738.1 hypothetical protein VOLCADRAFT_87512 [Volvox carteri f. nagariensis]|eukprot:XP_002947148.1 hypothetical protein VOLCADRAFT_87512 [Volvox carteri f. nagariensis]
MMTMARRIFNRCNLALCTSLSLLCSIHSVMSANILNAVGTVAIMRAIGERPTAQPSNPAASGIGQTVSVSDLVELRCPELVDPDTGFLKPDPNCSVPLRRLVRGARSVLAFQHGNQVLSGDKISAIFDIIDNGSSIQNSSTARRRLLSGRGAIPLLRPGSLQVLARNQQKEFYTGSPIQLRAVVYLLDMCGWMNPFRSAQAFRKYMFNSGPGSIEGNLQNYYQTCSYNKTLWDPANVAVVGPLTLDCQGTSVIGALQYPVDASKRCGAAEQIYWVKTANELAQKMAEPGSTLDIVLRTSTRRRVVVVLPGQVKCGFAGLADVACSGTTCRSYIKGTSAADVHVLFHELQHNYGLSHAGWSDDEYGDSTDPMGNSPRNNQGVHCHNAPYNWRAGWAGPVKDGMITSANFTPAKNRINFTLPASSISDMNMVIVDLGYRAPLPGSPFIPYPKYFLSYRVRNSTFGGYDGGMPGTYHQKVLIHNFNGTGSERDYNRSNYIDAGPRFTQRNPAFPAGNVWTAPFVPFNSSSGLGGGFRVIVVALDAISAVVEAVAAATTAATTTIAATIPTITVSTTPAITISILATLAFAITSTATTITTVAITPVAITAAATAAAT